VAAMPMMVVAYATAAATRLDLVGLTGLGAARDEVSTVPVACDDEKRVLAIDPRPHCT
jgi:hypothetical protein